MVFIMEFIQNYSFQDYNNPLNCGILKSVCIFLLSPKKLKYRYSVQLLRYLPWNSYKTITISTITVFYYYNIPLNCGILKSVCVFLLLFPRYLPSSNAFEDNATKHFYIPQTKHCEMRKALLDVTTKCCYMRQRLLVIQVLQE